MNNCPFCNPTQEPIASRGSASALRDGFPISPGHTLLVPKRHASSFLDLFPDEQSDLLNLLQKVMQIVERSWTVSRRRVAEAILQCMERRPWITETEKNFRNFMKAVNHRGGGRVFEFMADSDLNSFMDDCYSAANSELAR